MTSIRTAILTSLLLCAAIPGAGFAQDPVVDADLAKSASKLLMRFASFARGKKDGPMEKQAYDLIVNEYVPDDKRARKALDYRMVDGEWKLLPPAKRRRWVDASDREGRFKVQREWRATAEKLGVEHRELGLAKRSDGGELTDDGRAHLRRAILFNPLDQAAHEALGHVPWESNGFTYYGTPDEVAFMGRMKEIETQALTIALKEYEVEPVDEIPESMSKLGLEIYGAKSENFTVFTRGSQQNADDVVKWGERALDFLEVAVGKRGPDYLKRAKRQLTQWKWLGYLWTGLEMDDFKTANPDKLGDNPDAFANLSWLEENRICMVTTKLTPAQMQDHIIAHAWHYGLGAGLNEGLFEGIHHAATWFLKSTCITKYGALPEGTATEHDLILPEGANWWMREVRNQAIARTDTPLNVVPRTKLSKYAPEVRLKAWSFAVWAMARFPEKWLTFTAKIPDDRVPFPEDIDKVGAEVFGMPLAEVESQWRDWASGRGVTAAATGYGPPILPEFPNDTELAGLERLNEVRAAASIMPAFDDGTEKAKTASKEANAYGWLSGLPECELDSEATAACQDHSEFLTLHKDHWKWPEAHEEDPAKEGFSPRGMRAGMRSVIVMSEGQLDAADSVDQWIGTVYHRFPLLKYAIKRFGMAHADGPEGQVVTLDMGSLEEPPSKDRDESYAFCAWPPDGMKSVPRQFAYTEHPSPIEDVGLDMEEQKNTGYPVSLQFTDLVVRNSANVTMRLYEAKKRGRSYENGDEIPCWLHTPDVPLFKRMVLRDVVFVIPKEVLDSSTTYKAVVDMTYRGVPKTIEWTFTTGTKMQGLGRL